MFLQKGDSTLSMSDTGATITRWQWRNIHLFYQQQMALNNKNELHKRGGMFIAAPNFGAPGQAIMAGLPKHGLIRTAIPAEIQGTEDTARHAFSFEDSSGRDTYPFHWRMDTRVALTDDGFSHEINVERLRYPGYLRKEPMPFNVGIHPFFPGRGDIFFGEERLWSDQIKVSRPYPMPKDGMIIIGLSVGKIIMRCTGYECINVWSDNVAEYFCVEPIWTSPDLWGGHRSYVLPDPDDSSYEQPPSFGVEFSFSPNVY